MENEFLVGERKIIIAEAFMSEELGTVIWDAVVLLLYVF